jgi:hypothetical protein
MAKGGSGKSKNAEIVYEKTIHTDLSRLETSDDVVFGGLNVTEGVIEVSTTVLACIPVPGLKLKIREKVSN